MAKVTTDGRDGYDFSLSFFRVSDDNKVLKREKYELTSVDNKSVGLIFNRQENGRQRLTQYTDDISTDNFEDIIPDFMLNQIERFQNKTEVLNYFSDNVFFDVDNYDTLYKTYVSFTIPVKIKQLEVEPGYYAHDIYVPFPVTLRFEYDTDYKITKIHMGSVFYELPEEYIYDNVERSFNSINDLKLTYTSFSTACMNTEGGMIVTNRDDCTDWEGSPSISLEYVPYFVATKGDIKYDIENSVNGVARYDASNEKDLDYVINAKNTSDVVTSEIELVTYVPDEVIVKEDTISNNGVYNSSEHTITWTKDRMAIGEVLSVNYSAIAPDSKDEKELIGYSIIRSTQVTTGVQSNNTVVTLDNIVEIEETPSTPTNNSTPGNTTTNVDNPYTGAKNFMGDTSITVQFTILIIFAILVFLTSLMYGKKKKKDKVI